MKSLQETRPAILEINLDNLAYNMKILRDHTDEKTLIMAIVKANGYGHGAISASKVFLENGADRLGVSILPEGMELRNAGIEAPILILNYTPPSQYEHIIEYDLTQNIYCYGDAKLLSQTAALLKKEVNIHIKIDTGMCRIGFLPTEESIEDIIKISKLPYINIDGIFTHFAKSDEEDKSFTKLQFKRFIDIIDILEKKGVHIPIKHASNSAAALDIEDYNLDMIRPGLLLYGHYPSEEVHKKNLDIKPAMTLKCSISHIKTIPEGSGVSYNHVYVTKGERKIATLPIGYADGYSRMLTGKAQVYIKGNRVEVVGKICMDQMMIDITDIDDVAIGDEVILFGYEEENCPSVEDIAAWIGTSNYEIVCMMSRRVPRIYIRNNKLSHIVDYILD
nr:alanine racemase [Tissierella sp.]